MKKVGILGGGQLGRMLLQEAANYPVETWVMENDPECPAAHLCHHFIKGDIRNYDDVYRFGKQVDALTIEIESVNVEALEQLEAEGVNVFPRPAALRIIKNKVFQKEFYQNNGIPTAPFVTVNSRHELSDHVAFLPAAQKLGEGGYDGKGVQILPDNGDMAHLPTRPCFFFTIKVHIHIFHAEDLFDAFIFSRTAESWFTNQVHQR